VSAGIVVSVVEPAREGPFGSAAANPHNGPRPGRPDRGRLRGVTPWLTLALIVTAWECLGLDTGPSRPHLTLSALAQRYRAVHAAVLLVWILAGFVSGVAQRRRSPLAADAAPDAREPPAPYGGSPGALGLTLAHPRTELPALLLPGSAAAGVGFWVGVVLAGAGLELVARRSCGRIATTSEALQLTARHPVARLMIVAAWIFAGWHLFAH
jgi:hypothetical protein